MNLRWRVFGRNRTGDLTDYYISWVPCSPPLSYGDGWITFNLQYQWYLPSSLHSRSTLPLYAIALRPGTTFSWQEAVCMCERERHTQMRAILNWRFGWGREVVSMCVCMCVCVWLCLWLCVCVCLCVWWWPEIWTKVSSLEGKSIVYNVIHANKQIWTCSYHGKAFFPSLIFWSQSSRLLVKLSAWMMRVCVCVYIIHVCVCVYGCVCAVCPSPGTVATQINQYYSISCWTALPVSPNLYAGAVVAQINQCHSICMLDYMSSRSSDFNHRPRHKMPWHAPSDILTCTWIRRSRYRRYRPR